MNRNDWIDVALIVAWIVAVGSMVYTQSSH